jgi:hypothetical protein
MGTNIRIEDPQSLDARVRAHVYDFTMRTGAPPTSEEVARAMSLSRDAVLASFRRLADAHALVLKPDTGEILMANPFSAVPTPFLVECSGGLSARRGPERAPLHAYGNCIWDALGIPAMLGRGARIITSCADCGASAEITVSGGAVQGDGILHFAIPARDWWNDIVFT